MKFNPDVELTIEMCQKNPVWLLEDGITFSRNLEKRIAPLGYHCGITGSTLYKGLSFKDLDIIIYPHDVTKVDAETRKKVEEMLIMDFDTEIHKIDRLKYPDTKDVYYGYFGGQNGKRVDFFFLK